MQDYNERCLNNQVKVLNNHTLSAPLEIAELKSYGYNIRDVDGVWIATYGADCVIYVPENVSELRHLNLVGKFKSIKLFGGKGLQVIHGVLTDVVAHSIDFSGFDFSNVTKIGYLVSFSTIERFILDNVNLFNITKISKLLQDCTVNTAILHNISFNHNVDIGNLLVVSRFDNLVINNVGSGVKNAFNYLHGCFVRDCQLLNLTARDFSRYGDGVITNTVIHNLKIFKCHNAELFQDILNYIDDWEDCELKSLVGDFELSIEDSNRDDVLLIPVTFRIPAEVAIMCANYNQSPNRVDSTKAYINFSHSVRNGRDAFADAIYYYESVDEVVCSIPNFTTEIDILPPPCKHLRIVGGKSLKTLRIHGLGYEVDFREIERSICINTYMSGKFADALMHNDMNICMFASKYDALDLSMMYMLRPYDFEHRGTYDVQINTLLLPEYIKDDFTDYTLPKGYVIDCVDFPGCDYDKNFEDAIKKMCM